MASKCALQRQSQTIFSVGRQTVSTLSKSKNIILPKKKFQKISVLGAGTKAHSEQNHNSYETWKILPITAALVASSALFNSSHDSHEEKIERGIINSRGYVAKCDAANVAKGWSSNVNRKSEPRRNVMLHRMRSVRARHLDDKYNVYWKNVLGEGAYGSVHPARLAATGQKVSQFKVMMLLLMLIFFIFHSYCNVNWNTN